MENFLESNSFTVKLPLHCVVKESFIRWSGLMLIGSKVTRGEAMDSGKDFLITSFCLLQTSMQYGP